MFCIAMVLSPAVLDINELKSMGLSEKIKIGETVRVVERLEDKLGEVVVSVVAQN